MLEQEPRAGRTGDACLQAGSAGAVDFSARWSAGLHLPVLIAFAVYVGLTSIMHFAWYVDYVGPDNDDVMRLVQVRDLLAGQNWFDLTQYRLGLEAGTQMHWSRLVDLPLSNLILLFSSFLAPQQAEAAALFVWPLATALPIFYAAAIGGRSLAAPDHGRIAAVVGLIWVFLFALSIKRFQPGGIDHHNVQLALMSVIAAALVLPGHRALPYAIAGFAAATAIAIGAETMPHLAVVCAAVALIWLWQGTGARAAANAFSLVMAAALTFFFYLAVPPSQYGIVVCDALSTGYYVLGVVGASGLFIISVLLSGRSFAVRLAGLGAVGVAMGFLALAVSPQCLGNPLATLDPLLVTMWLDFVTEAQPVTAQLSHSPWTAAGYYGVPLIAMGLCIARIRRGERVEAHLVLLTLIAVSFAVALIQVRGAVFANLLSVFPFVPLIARLRESANADAKDLRKGLRFAAVTLASVPFVWAIAGAGLKSGYGFVTGAQAAVITGKTRSCGDVEAMQPLAGEPTGAVASPSNIGAEILRFTRHRALSAPYHRNQDGMLAELRIGMAAPSDALRLLQGAGVTLVAFCGSDPQARSVAKTAPDGLYAALAQGRVPDYLELVPATAGTALEIFRVRP